MSLLLDFVLFWFLVLVVVVVSDDGFCLHFGAFRAMLSKFTVLLIEWIYLNY